MVSNRARHLIINITIVRLRFNLLMPGGNKKVTPTEKNLQLKAAGLFKYA